MTKLDTTMQSVPPGKEADSTSTNQIKSHERLKYITC